MSERYNSTQLTVLRWTPLVPALLSIGGSCLIVQRVLRSAKLRDSTYERLMVGLSSVDILLSITFIIFPLKFCPFVKPSTACTLNGFLLTVCFAGPLYNTVLSFYYLLIVVYNVPDQRIKQRYEPFFHGLAIGYAMIGGIVGLVLKVFNPISNTISCWAAEWPQGCQGDECRRGEHAALFKYTVGVVPLLGVLVALIVNNVLIFRTVRRAVIKTTKYTSPTVSVSATLRSSMSHDNTNNVDFAEQARPTEAQPPTTVSKTRLVAVQSIFYVLAYLLCFIWPLLILVAGMIDPEGMQSGNYFLLIVLQMVFYPSQGFFNTFVYARPMYLRLRRQFPEMSRWKCFHRALLETGE